MWLLIDSVTRMAHVRKSLMRIRNVGVVAFALLNILYGLVGAYYFVAMSSLHWREWITNQSALGWVVFVSLSAICLLLSSLVGVMGIRQLMGNESTFHWTAILLALVLFYFVADVLVFWIIAPQSLSAMTFGFWEVAEGPLVPQLITGYPVWGGLAMIVFWKSSDRSGLNRAKGGIIDAPK